VVINCKGNDIFGRGGGGDKNLTKEQGGETWNAAVFLQCIFQITHRESNEGLRKTARNERKD